MLLAFLLLIPFALTDAATLRHGHSSSKKNEPGVSALARRELQLDGIRDLKPLTCNANIAKTRCKTWTAAFGTRTSYSSRVVIPCGQCILMNLGGGSLQLLDGLDIQGKLFFPNGYRLNLTSSAIVVQGELQMTSLKQVNGVPDVVFTMIGSLTNTTFTPVDVNANACKGVSTCTIGKKAIVVAGGKITLRGLPAGTPAWTRLYDAIGGTYNNPTTILVPNTVKGKWGPGAQILITSHTRVWNEHQERTIVSVADATVRGYTALTLNAPIIRPTTIVENRDFAVEVALLSRNILWVGGSDPTTFHGGHFMVFHTPAVIQMMEGIEIRNFGQQGLAGRYPIHFHFSGNVTGSVVSKNSIRQSPQRCVVVHGSNQLLIADNVAFDTKGHCYITEDGMETGNIFLRNLGAKTDVPERLIPNTGPNGIETDDEPATFWITNPNNSWEGNVAAGSINAGFWFEPKLRGVLAPLYPGYDPQIVPIISFKDNVGHSNVGSTGAIRMYPKGYQPTSIVTLEGLKLHRNAATGIFVHRSQNVRISGGLFADNNIGVDIDRAEGVEVVNSVIIGESESYRQLMARQPTVKRVCRDGQDRWLVGIDLHTWKKEKAWAGAKISNVTLSGLRNVMCPNVASIRYDSQTLKQGLFEFYTSFEKMKNTDGADSINFCIVNQPVFQSMYLIDLDGTLRPSNVAAPRSASTLLANDDRLLDRFVNPAITKCTSVAAGCYQYCPNTCFRSMRYEAYINTVANPKLKVCLRANKSVCSLFPAGKRATTDPWTFTAHLPDGQLYDAVLVDGTTLAEFSVPSVLQEVEPSFCPAGSSAFNVTLYASLPKV